MTDKTYNGWTNYETWAVKLWMDNEQSSYNHWKERAAECWENAEATKPSQLTRDEVACRDLADALKDEHEEGWQEVMEAAGKHVHMSSSIWADLMGAALCEVNWYEIAQHYIENTDKTQEPEE